MASAKRTTLRDLAAAAELGSVDPSTEVLTKAEHDDAMAELAAEAIRQTVQTVTAPKSGTEHDCAIPGCRHGAAHGPTQPDRQVKLQCPSCGAVARMTERALSRAGGTISDVHGTFARAAHRTYTKPGTVAA